MHKSKLVTAILASLLGASSASAAGFFIVAPVQGSVQAPNNPGSGSGSAGGQVPEPVITLSELQGPAAIAFGDSPVGSAVSRTVFISNTGNKDTAVSYSGLPSVVTMQGDCASIAQGQQCEITLHYLPADGSTLNANLLVAGADNQVSVGLSGKGLRLAQLTGGGSLQSFGQVTTGQSASVAWTLQNTGDIAQVMEYGAVPAGITRGGTCGASLAGGASCSVSLSWTPTAAGSLSNTLTVSGQQLSYQGTAVAPLPPVTATNPVITNERSPHPACPDEGQVFVDIESVVKNNSNAAINLSVVSGNVYLYPSSIAANSSATVMVSGCDISLGSTLIMVGGTTLRF